METRAKILERSNNDMLKMLNNKGKAKGYGNQLKLNVIVIVTTNKQIFGDGGQQFDI